MAVSGGVEVPGCAAPRLARTWFLAKRGVPSSHRGLCRLIMGSTRFGKLAHPSMRSTTLQQIPVYNPWLLLHLPPSFVGRPAPLQVPEGLLHFPLPERPGWPERLLRHGRRLPVRGCSKAAGARAFALGQPYQVGGGAAWASARCRRWPRAGGACASRHCGPRSVGIGRGCV